jgi:hypothetical protein
MKTAEDNQMLAELQRTNQLLAILVIRGIDNGEAATLLKRVGYTMRESGQLLGLTTNAVNLALRRTKAGSRKRKRSTQHKAPSD